MNNEPKKTSDKPGSNYQEPLPKGKVPAGDKAVKQPEDEIYIRKPSNSTYPEPAKYKENSEQPVHPVKHPPRND